MMMLLLCTAILGLAVSYSSASDVETEIVRRIYGTYDEARLTVLPRSAPDGVVHLQFGVNAVEMLEFDEESRSLTLHGWLHMMWNDANISWNPENHGGVSNVKLNSKHIWTPDMAVYNGRENDMDLAEESLVLAQSTGDIFWVPPVNLKVTCTFVAEGEYTCPFKIGSWTHHGLELTPTFYNDMERMDVENYKENDYYEISSNTAVLEEKVYPCCPEPYPSFTFTLGITKKTTAK